MAEKTRIGWTHSTFNPWVGCTEVGPGCDNCYARELDKRHRWHGTVHWGAGVPRFRTSASTWRGPLVWNKKAAANPALKPWRVFCASLADVFDNEVPSEWRFDLWRLIEATPNLSWLLVTKRVGNVYNMVPWKWQSQFPDNVRLLITVCNQEEADRDIPKLLALPCKNGISYEPALGPVDFHFERGWCRHCKIFTPGTITGHCMDPKSPCFEAERTMGDSLNWIIVGGESTQGAGKARPFDLTWARSTVAQCKTAGVPMFVKQLGSHPYDSSATHVPVDTLFIKDRAGADPAEWPGVLRVQEFP